MPYNTIEKKKKYNRMYWAKNREKLIERRKIWEEENPIYKKDYYIGNRDYILEYHKQYRMDNPELMLKRDRQYRENNPEKITKAKKKYYENNKEKIAKYRKKYLKDNKCEIKERRKKQRQRDKEKIAIYSKKYRENNKEYFIKYREDNLEYMKEYSKKWNQTENGKASKQRRATKRRMRERIIINTLTAQEWLNILEKYNYRCAYCDVEFDCENLPHKDHVIPISKGGYNVKENIVPACKSCNSRKGNKILQDEEVTICLSQ